MKIDVVVPVYNVRPWIRECLDSLVCQTKPFNKIIIVDDGSDDGSEIICDGYAERFCNVEVIHQMNAGLGNARNVGITRIQANYFIFVDSDDYLSKEAVEILTGKLEESGYDALYFDGDSFNSDGESREAETYVWKRNSENKLDISGKQFFIDVYPENYTCTSWLTVYSIDLWKRNDFSFPEGVMHEDICISYEYMDKAKNVGYVPEFLYHRRYRPNSIMTSIDKTIEKNLEDISKQYCSVFEYIKNTIDQNDKPHRDKECIYIEQACRYTKYLFDTYCANKKEPNKWVDMLVRTARSIKPLYYPKLSEWKISDLIMERRFAIDLNNDNWLKKDSLLMGFDNEIGKELVKRYIKIVKQITTKENKCRVGIYGCGKWASYFVDCYEWVMCGDISNLVFIETSIEHDSYKGQRVYSIYEDIPSIDVLVITSSKYNNEMAKIAQDNLPDVPIHLMCSDQATIVNLKSKDYLELQLNCEIRKEIVDEEFS